MRKLAAICLAVARIANAQLSPTETLQHFIALIKIDTSNPPGNESKAAEYVKSVLEKDGIEAKLFAQDAGRANLVARLKGNGSKKPLLIMGHTDVVGTQRDKWSVDPFAAVAKGGYIYGRGTTDDKDNLVACLMTMLELKRRKVQLDRDVIFLAEAGEEATSRVGIDFMVREHWPEIEAEFALAESWGGLARNGKPVYMQIATTEKVPHTVKLRATGTSGHGSKPRPDNSIVHLAGAVAKVAAWQPPMRLNTTTQTYFERLASVSPVDEARRYREIVVASKAPEIDRYFTQHELEHASIIRTSISPTMFQGGFRSNVIPSVAEATLDIRSLPDENMPAFYEQLRKLIADKGVEVIPAPDSRPPGESSFQTDMFRVLESTQKKVYPGAISIPVMMTGATDMAQLRAKGVQAYGIGPIPDEQDQLNHGAHSDDERIEVVTLHRFVEFLYGAVLKMASKKQ